MKIIPKKDAVETGGSKMRDLDLLQNEYNNNGLFKGLEDLYESIPDGKCSGCTACCSESVNTSFVEFVNIYKYLGERTEIFSEVIEKIFDFYFTEYVERKKCPFLKDSKCLIYPVRPLPCRTFGHLNRADYEKNYSDVLKINRETQGALENEFGFRVPDAVVEFKIPYCEDFIVEEKMDEEVLNNLRVQLLSMDVFAARQGDIDEDLLNLSLVYWFIYLYLEPEEASELRVDFTKELLEKGTSQGLDNLIQELLV